MGGSVFTGGLSLYVNFNMMTVYSPPKGQECDEAGAAKIKDQLIAEQQRKDADLGRSSPSSQSLDP